MKKIYFALILLLISRLALGVTTVRLTYQQVQEHQGLTTLAPSNQLVITNLDAAHKATLTLTYNFGTAFAPLAFDAANQTITYVLSADCAEIDIQLYPGNRFSLDLVHHTVIVGNNAGGQVNLPPVVPPPAAPVVPPAHPVAPAPVPAVTIAPADYTGIAFWDAIKLYNYLQNHMAGAGPDNDQLKLIVSHYYTGFTTYADWKANNPFLNRGFNLTGAVPVGTANDLNSVLGGVDVTNVVQALADFLSERIKQELTIAYLQKLKDAFANNLPIRKLLPNTYEAFKDNDLFNLPSLGATFKQAFAQDLAALPDNFINYVYQNGWYDHLQAQNQEYFIIGASVYSLINQTAKGFHPSVSLHNLAMQYPFTTDQGNKLVSRYVLNVLDMFSQSLQKAPNLNGWIQVSDLSQQNPNIVRLYFALLYQKYTVLFTQQELSKTLVSLADDLNSVQLTNNINNFVTLVQNIDKNIQDFQNIKSDPTVATAEKNQTAVTFFLNNSDSMIDLLNYAFTIVDPQDVHDSTYTAIIKGASDAVNIAKGVHSNDFAQASNASIAFITDVFANSDNAGFIKPLKTIVNLANDVVAAKSAADIKTVIETYAAPVQSYLAVRKMPFSFTLSAYPGVYAGTEYSKQNGEKLFDHGTFGVTAPFGFALNWGDKDKASSSKSVFISMIDIGAALSYRFNNSTSDIPDKITLGQIFSPGIHFVYGIKNSPLAIKLGYQYAPELRQITNDMVNTTTGGVGRLSLGLCVDLPIFFFTAQPQ